MKKPTLSIVITTHHEGIMAHKTILSVLAGLEKTTHPYEIIINLDNPDTETTDYFARHKKDPHFVFNRTTFGEPSSARNAAIKLAKGKYISVLDGDDLLSENFFAEFFKLAAAHEGEDFIVHAGATMQFGEGIPLTAWPQANSTDQPITTYKLVGTNLWTAAAAAATADVFHKYPYAPAIKGFGYEDWWFNSETYAAGIKHYVTNTTLFYRKKAEDSVFASHKSDHTVVAYTNLLDTARVKSLSVPPLSHQQLDIPSRGRLFAKKSIKFAYKTAIALPLVKVPALAIGRKVEQKLARRRFDTLPKFLHQNWEAISHIEPLIEYSRPAAEHIVFQSYEDEYLGIVYRHITEYISAEKPVDRIYMIGDRLSALAKKTLIKSIRRDLERHPNWHVVVLADLGIKVPSVDFVNFDQLTRQLNHYEKDRMFSRLVVQLKTKDIIVAESNFFFRWIRDHAKLIENNDYVINAMIFTPTFAPILTSIYHLCTKIITSNSAVINFLVEDQAFDPAKIKAIDNAADN